MGESLAKLATELTNYMPKKSDKLKRLSPMQCLATAKELEAIASGLRVRASVLEMIKEPVLRAFPVMEYNLVATLN
jgi:hypothetical protein